jgi:hypothetical protein
MYIDIINGQFSHFFCDVGGKDDLRKVELLYVTNMAFYPVRPLSSSCKPFISNVRTHVRYRAVYTC